MISDLVLPFGGAALGVGACPVAVAQPADGDQVKRAVGLAVAAEVEAMPGGFAGGGGHRTRAAECSERRFAAEPVDVLSGGDEQPAGVTGGDPEQAGRTRRCLADERLELPVEHGDLVVERV